jgi:hypothetical protein
LTQTHIDFIAVHYAQNKKSVPEISRLLKMAFDMDITRQAIEYQISKPQNFHVFEVAREGVLAVAAKRKTKLKLAAIPYADALWQMDASPIALFYLKDGKKRKVTWSAYIVKDVYSGKTIGLAFGETESSDLVKLALLHAVKNTGYLPNCLRYDGGSGNISESSKKLMDTLSRYHFKTEAYNPTGKAQVERAVHQIEKVLQHFDNFAGGNITGRSSEKRFNPDVVARMKKEGRMPDELSQVFLQYWLAVQAVNHKIGKDGRTPTERYEDSHESRRIADTATISNAFWTKRDRTIRYEAGGIKLHTDNGILQYWVGNELTESYDFKVRNEGKSFVVRTNPSDPTLIALFNEKDEFISEAVLSHLYSQLPEHRAEGEGSGWKKMQAQNKRYIAESVLKYNDAKERTEQKGLPTHYDFAELHKDELSKIEGEHIESLLLEMQNTSPKKGNKIGIEKAKPLLIDPIELPNDEDDLYSIY